MESIIPFDWPRIFWGAAPPLFLAEIAFRVLVIWLWTVCLLRWIGGRSISQLSLVEFLLIIALGSAVGDAMFYPEVPLIHAMLVILVLVLLDKGVDLAIRRWQGAKRVIDGTPLEVIRDGRILCDGMAVRGMGASELMEILRMKGIENLAEVRAAYLEPSGMVSTFRADAPGPGLRICPPIEITKPEPPQPGSPACCRCCGHVATDSAVSCGECGGNAWVRPELPARYAASDGRSRRSSDMSGAAS
ncbi:DUF421 domain-containing protein [Neotabrizicola sp. sgz301269]|uniref:DUF421 domain-containing protein n=1 Tax=Neotabrizicola sp. sgz301269 TaxID=3276282 RepID=UPI00376FA453